MSVGFVFSAEHDDAAARINGQIRMAVGRFAQSLTQQPSLEEGHKAVHVFAAGDHLVDAPLGGQTGGDAVGVAGFGLAQVFEYVGNTRGLEYRSQIFAFLQLCGGPLFPVQIRSKLVAVFEQNIGKVQHFLLRFGGNAQLF